MRFHTSVQIPILTPVPVITQSPPLEPAPFGMKIASYVDALPPAERSLLIAGIYAGIFSSNLINQIQTFLFTYLRESPKYFATNIANLS